MIKVAIYGQFYNQFPKEHVKIVLDTLHTAKVDIYVK